MLRKISKQKKTIENQIRGAKYKQEEFRLITENMKEGFLVLDKQMKILTYNNSASAILDNKYCLDNFQEVIGKALDGKRAERDLTLNEISYNIIANPVFEDKEIIGAVIIIIDVTENVKHEQLRREFTSNVSHELKTPLTSIYQVLRKYSKRAEHLNQL